MTHCARPQLKLVPWNPKIFGEVGWNPWNLRENGIKSLGINKKPQKTWGIRIENPRIAVF